MTTKDRYVQVYLSLGSEKTKAFMHIFYSLKQLKCTCLKCYKNPSLNSRFYILNGIKLKYGKIL